MNARFHKRTFHFKRPSGTSRGVLTEKHSWFIEVWQSSHPAIIGIGECSVIPGLSPDFKDFESYELQLKSVYETMDQDISNWPSIKFGLETAMLDLQNGGKGIIFDNEFARGEKKIPINGLIWMGDPSFMLQQIEEKLDAGFTTLKMKIGALDFESEYAILKSIRKRYSADEITLRVDANGSFTMDEVMEKLELLAKLSIHSIEQPIKAGQWDNMAKLCKETPMPIALDEELIACHSPKNKNELLETIKPQFIILKPSLHGGISGTTEWIELAEKSNIPWWMTSALESNIGLNAICQFAAEFDNILPQGLGTGSLFTDNIESKLCVERGEIFWK